LVPAHDDSEWTAGSGVNSSLLGITKRTGATERIVLLRRAADQPH
jgi:hypothetical protein